MSARALMVVTSSATTIACLGLYVVQESARAAGIGSAMFGALLFGACAFYGGRLWSAACARDGVPLDEGRVIPRPVPLRMFSREHRPENEAAS